MATISTIGDYHAHGSQIWVTCHKCRWAAVVDVPALTVRLPAIGKLLQCGVCLSRGAEVSASFPG
jgi:hypothetical protein